MYLKSKVKLNYNQPISGQASDYIIGRILSFEMDGELTQINAGYEYAIEVTNEEGETGTMSIVRGRYQADEETLTQLYAYTDANMPEGLSSRDQEKYRRYAGFLFEMVETFKAGNPELTESDIEIVPE